MRLINLILYVGIVMVIAGLITNFTIDSRDYDWNFLRHGGTFVGLMGIGVSIAGFLLFVINRPPKADVQNLEE